MISKNQGDKKDFRDNNSCSFFPCPNKYPGPVSWGCKMVRLSNVCLVNELEFWKMRSTMADQGQVALYGGGILQVKKIERRDHSFLCLWWFKKEIEFFFNSIFFTFIPFYLAPCRQPQLLISSGDCLKCRYFDLILLWAISNWDYKTKPGHSEEHLHYIVHFLQPIYIYIHPHVFVLR